MRDRGVGSSSERETGTRRMTSRSTLRVLATVLALMAFVTSLNVLSTVLTSGRPAIRRSLHEHTVQVPDVPKRVWEEAVKSRAPQATAQDTQLAEEAADAIAPEIEPHKEEEEGAAMNLMARLPVVDEPDDEPEPETVPLVVSDNEEEEEPETTVTPTEAPTTEVIHIHYTAKHQASSTEDDWRAINAPDVQIHYYSDADSEALVRAYRPEFLETYKSELSPVERADYFRYLVLWVHGGVYVDSDTKFIAPVHNWLSTFGWGTQSLQSLDAVVGVEFLDARTHYKHTPWLPLQFTQFVIAGAKGSAVLESVVQHVEHCIRTIDRGGDVEMTIERTGPAAFTTAILQAIETGGVVASGIEEMHANVGSDPRYPRALMPPAELEKTGQLIEWRRPPSETPARSLGVTVGSILVLPYRAFSYHQFHHIAVAPVLTKHLFHNSWRSNA